MVSRCFPAQERAENKWYARGGAAGRVLLSRRELPLYEPGRAGETLLGELAVTGLEFDTEIRASGEGGCDEGAAAAGERVQDQVAGA